jgi:5-methylcytosine-specific restriction protein A
MTVPYKPRRACSFPGCPRLTPGQYCGEHKKKIDREYNLYRRDDFSRKFYNSPEWKKLRNLKLSMNPLCEHCEKEGKLTPATVCDHIVPIREGGAKLDINNLQSLCRYHDDVKGLKDRKMI